MSLIRKKHLSLALCLVGGLSCVLFAVLGLTTVRNVRSYQALSTHNALGQGYWIAQAWEMRQQLFPRSPANGSPQGLLDTEPNAAIRVLALVDAEKKVLRASDPSLEGTTWPDDLIRPPGHGRIIKRERDTIYMVFPSAFVRANQIILVMDISQAQAHYREMLTERVLVSLSVILVGLSAFGYFGLIQRYALAHASIAHLEHIKHHLARFVPGTVQRLIEANPEQPLLDKVERDATILFLDIEQYTVLAAAMPPEALNRLIERYFSAFLDTILICGGEINETAGDGLMAIFTANNPRTHAVNATRAAMTIREQAMRLNAARQPTDPDILVNIGLSTGPVLLGATQMMTHAGQERLTYTASGLVTNIAARLCALASHGDIYLSEATAHLIGPQFTLDEPTYEHVKNLSEEIRVYKRGVTIFGTKSCAKGCGWKRSFSSSTMGDENA